MNRKVRHTDIFYCNKPNQTLNNSKISNLIVFLLPISIKHTLSYKRFYSLLRC